MVYNSGGPSPYQPPGTYAGPPPQSQSASTRAILALVCGIAAFVSCGCISAVPAAILGHAEVKAIESGEAPPAGKTLAQVGFWLGIANVALTVLVLLAYVVLVVGIGVSSAVLK